MLLGYWAGAGPGAAAALAGLVSAAILQVAVDRQGAAAARRARLAAAEDSYAPRVITLAAAGTAGPGDAAGGGVARYLRPEAEAVRFWLRPELDELVSWVVSEERVAVRLVAGAGGSGKTRLARQLGEQAAGVGWRSYFLAQ